MKKAARHLSLLFTWLVFPYASFSWGFYGHQKINYYAVFLLPPEMMVLFKPNISFISEHAVDPDKRRYAVPAEGPRHYIDIDHYGKYPFDSLPRKWNDALAKFGEDSLNKYGIVPWYVQTMLYRLTGAFKEKNFAGIMKLAAEMGHYIADAHVPLHANSNHNGQFSNQKGIHAFWESRVPELLAEKEFDFFIGKAEYIQHPGDFTWKRVLESAKASDSVLAFERQLTLQFADDKKYSFEERNARLNDGVGQGKVIRQYSAAFSIAYNKKLDGMIERRMRQSIYAIASFWYTAWVNAGQPNLKGLVGQKFSAPDLAAFEQLNAQWNSAGKMTGREEQ
ncbi:MAG TPA: zinc dependent phospholipase C family protein [Ferruginibacter sp.]|nr:zinc dependent phospholipase C family protein [Ferruginibacter sp.]